MVSLRPNPKLYKISLRQLKSEKIDQKWLRCFFCTVRFQSVRHATCSSNPVAQFAPNDALRGTAICLIEVFLNHASFLAMEKNLTRELSTDKKQSLTSLKDYKKGCNYYTIIIAFLISGFL